MNWLWDLLGRKDMATIADLNAKLTETRAAASSLKAQIVELKRQLAECQANSGEAVLVVAIDGLDHILTTLK